MSINPYGDDFYPERKPVQKPGQQKEPNYVLWGLWTFLPFIVLILWATTSLGAMLQLIFLIPCLAIASGKYQIDELLTIGMPDDPFK